MCRQRNCNEARKAANKVRKEQPALKAKVLAPEVLTVPGEGQRMWNWLLFGFGSLNNFVRGYAVLEVPGDVLEQLHSLHATLGETIRMIETRASQTNGKKAAK